MFVYPLPCAGLHRTWGTRGEQGRHQLCPWILESMQGQRPQMGSQKSVGGLSLTTRSKEDHPLHEAPVVLHLNVLRDETDHLQYVLLLYMSTLPPRTEMKSSSNSKNPQHQAWDLVQFVTASQMPVQKLKVTYERKKNGPGKRVEQEAQVFSPFTKKPSTRDRKYFRINYFETLT